MDERKEKILCAVVRDFILTNEPVGSRTITRKYNLGVSPATVRNEMSDLEEMGFIEQPHTSAGRIPSDRGYRYYVDYLMERCPVSFEEENLIKKHFASIGDSEGVFFRAGGLLAQLTNYVSVILGPKLGDLTAMYLRLLPVSPGNILLVLVTDVSSVEHRMLAVAEEVEVADLDQISWTLNLHLKGMTLASLGFSDLQDMRLEAFKQRKLLTLVLETIDELLQDEEQERVYLSGTLNLLNLPEFREVKKVQGLLDFLEQEDVLRQAFRGNDPGLSVKIGGENTYQELHNYSLIRAPYGSRDRLAGIMGVLGPTRMDYSRSLAMVEAIRNILSSGFEKF